MTDLTQVFKLTLPAGMSGFDLDRFSNTHIGTSDCSEYIPAYALFGHELHIFQDGEGKNRTEVMEYSLPNFTGSATRQYYTFFRCLKDGSYPEVFQFRVARVDHRVGVFRGVIYDMEGNILMCLGVNSNYVMNTEPDVITTTPDVDKFVLFISEKFSEDKYKNMRKKLEADYMPLVRNANIDIMQTQKIEKWLFSNNYKVPTFKNVMELKKHLKEYVPKLMLEL